MADAYASEYAYYPHGASGVYVSPVLAQSVPVNTQFHAQSELGEYNYGYSNQDSAKTETKSIDGVTRGSYSYVDANGLVQTVNYLGGQN